MYLKGDCDIVSKSSDACRRLPAHYTSGSTIKVKKQTQQQPRKLLGIHTDISKTEGIGTAYTCLGRIITRETPNMNLYKIYT